MKKLQFGNSIAKTLALVLLLSFFTGCEKKSDSIIDTTGSTPSLTNVSISPATINTDTIFVGTTKNPTDVLRIQIDCFASELLILDGETKKIKSVHARLVKDLGSSALGSGELFDNGVAPDRSLGDLTFSGKISFEIKRVDVGTYKVEIFALDKAGIQSSGYILPLTIFRSNKPPVISNLQAPDTVSLGNQDQTLLLQVKATDPDGAGDIQRVFFNSFLPSGQPSSQNPFLMSDNGTNGDINSGDGTYSLRINLPAATTPGTYRFEFQAFDKSNEASNTIIHRVTVRP